MIENLLPGLYEMVIADDAGNADIGDYAVRLEARDISDILAMDDGLEDEEAFVPVAAVSQVNDAFYHNWIGPWVRAWTQPWMAEGLRQLHPLRFQRYAYSDANPFLWPLDIWSSLVKQNRRPAAPDNPFVQAETCFSDFVTAAFNLYRDSRDRLQEWVFKSIYENPWARFCLGGATSADGDAAEDA